jgi:hypothetical protein
MLPDKLICMGQAGKHLKTRYKELISYFKENRKKNRIYPTYYGYRNYEEIYNIV